MERRSNHDSFRKAALFGAALLLGLWCANAWLPFGTIAPADTDGSRDPALWESHNPDALSPVQHALRRTMIAIDRATDLPPRRRGLSFWLLIGLPALASAWCLAAALTSRKARTRLSGEVLWSRSLFDPSAHPEVAIDSIVRVTANLVEKHGPDDGTYDVLEPIAVAAFGRPYRKFEWQVALPFRMEGLPLEVPLVVESLVAEDFPVEPGQGGRVHGSRHRSAVALTPARPVRSDLVLKLEVLDR